VKPVVRHSGLVPFNESWQQMRDFTDHRDHDSADELWCPQHPPVFTLGQAGKPEHILNAENIPVIQTDRGGQVTYHGPGQLVIYTLIDLRRHKLGVRALVSLLENSLIEFLHHQGIIAQARPDAPGVYINNAKIAAIGLRIRHGCSYHGLSLNIDMDLSPFQQINPCGYPGLAVTQLKDHGVTTDLRQVARQLSNILVRRLAYP